VAGNYSVSDPHSLHADPDPAFLPNADPDPDLALRVNADPDRGKTLKKFKSLNVTLKAISLPFKTTK
jgi:hypothetical protein